MTRISRTAGLAFAALAAATLGLSAAPAQAQESRNSGWHGGYYYGWNGGYYRSPPVVYGSPYRYRYYAPPRYYPPPRAYYPPPVVYGPGVSFGFTIR